MKIFFCFFLFLLILEYVCKSDQVLNSGATITYDYYVCGNVKKDVDCTCSNSTISCLKSTNWYYYNSYFKSANVKILNESFTVKIAEFFENELMTLRKDKVLPGIEHTVEILRLSSNNIYRIENETFDKFAALKQLDLSYNNLKNISAKVFSKQIGSTLEKLAISKNQFKSIFALNLSNLINLKELDLYENRYLGSNDSFSKYFFPDSLSNLTTLLLARCGITFFNDNAFINLVSLEELLLYGNPLISFPKSIGFLENLKFINLDETHITVLNYTDDFNRTNTKLEKFYLSKSMLEMIDDCAFCNYPNLKELLLSKNHQLSFIHENAFGLAYNGLTSPSLDIFTIEDCKLQIIPENLLNWHNIKSFGLGWNPFMCNCSMAWLINDLLSPTHTMNLKTIVSRDDKGMDKIEYLKCSGPFALKDIPMVQISHNFCPNFFKKEMPEKIFIDAKTSPFFISWFHICAGIALIFIGIVVGMPILPFIRGILYSKKYEISGFNNHAFPDESISFNNQDFDNGKY